MIRYVLLFFVFSPLVGIIAMEFGALGTSVSRYGYFNGAALAYSAYALVLVVFSGGALRAPAELPAPDPERGRNFAVGAVCCLLINGVFLALIVVFFGGLEVLTGDVAKGEFRTVLGGLGALAFWILRFFAPALLAYLSFGYLATDRSPEKRVLLAINFAVAFLLGLSWGFKTSALFVILPATIVLYWRITMRQAMTLGALAGTAVISTYYLFDRSNEPLAVILNALLVRVTVIQGDVSWFMWGLARSGYEFPPYARTLMAGIGDQMLSATVGITRTDAGVWISYHYDMLITWLVGNTPERVLSGHSVSGTPFSEGLIAFGIPGFLLYGALAGLLLALNLRILVAAMRRESAMVTAIAATYFSSLTLGWINSGAIVQFFHVSNLVGLAAAAVLVSLVERARRASDWLAQPAFLPPAPDRS